MTFENSQRGNGGVITLKNDTEEVGRLTYTIMPEKNTLVISFVMVHPKFEGRGMGKFLVEEGVRFARQNAWTIYPHCSYARSVLRRMDNVSDVFTE